MSTRLIDLFPPEHLRVPIEAQTLAGAAHTLAGALAASGAVSHPELLEERIEEARPEDIVSLVERAFILHYRSDAADRMGVALGVCRRPLCRELGDDGTQCAQVVALVCSPPRQTARHLQVVTALSSALARAENTSALVSVSSADQVRSLPFLLDNELPEQLLVRALMSTQPRSIHAEAPLRAALRQMVGAGLGALPVVDEDNRVIGMLSEKELLRDLLSRYLPRAGAATAPQPPSSARRRVADLMTRKVLCVAPDQPAAEVASLMLNKDVDHVPVVKNDRLVGYLTRGDIVRKLMGP